MSDSRPETTAVLPLLQQPELATSLSASGSGYPQCQPDAVWRQLKAWQERLADHFGRLAASRREAGWPVFALEHGLSASERGQLMADVRAAAAKGPRREVALPWVVYAAEMGYEYSGFEYWQTFESNTPGWEQHWRDSVRARFQAFAASYGGAEPDGDWAYHFNIIAWPITHGILPRDLQRQLAELLYDASTTFRAETFSSAEALGRHLQARSHDCSSRFRQFAENAVLLGQIALALLLHETADAPGGAAAAILHPDTLSRIVGDLNRERDASQWLADARSVARFRIRGLARIPLRGRLDQGTAEGGRTSESADAEAVPKPRILLREAAADTWQVRLQLPNLAHLAARSPRSHSVLMRSQGRVAGAAVPILAAGRIVRDAAPTVTLAAWPAPQTQLLSFAGSPPELDAVLRAGFRFETRDRWLFAIGSDCVARELATRVLRAGASYLLLQRTETRNPPTGLGLRAVHVSCSGIFGLRIDVPKSVPDVLLELLSSSLGLEVAETLEVWPVGLPVAQWSGDGHAEWIAGSDVVLGIRSDRRLEGLTVVLDGALQPDIAVAATEPSDTPVFIELPLLRPGPHHMLLEAHPVRGEEMGPVATQQDGRVRPTLRGELWCDVRESRSAATGQAGALSFAVLPTSPSLEDIWEDRVEMHVAAPGADRVRCRIVLRAPGSRELFNQTLFLDSPCDTLIWRREFAKVRNAAAEKYDEAQDVVLEFDGGAIGRRCLTVERDFRSLRWAIRANGCRAVVIDQQGNGNITASAYRCATPAAEMPLDVARAPVGFDVEDGGGLFVARRGLQTAAVVVVPPQTARDFASLLIRPQVAVSCHQVAEIRALIALAQLWETARQGGAGLTRARQQLCTQAILSAAFGVLGGRPWEAVEAQIRRGDDVRVILRGNASLLAPAKLDHASKYSFERRLTPLATTPEADLEQEFASAVSWLTRDSAAVQSARFALALTSSPTAACEWAESHPLPDRPGTDQTERYLHCLCNSQFIARAARYVALLRTLQAGGR